MFRHLTGLHGTFDKHANLIVCNESWLHVETGAVNASAGKSPVSHRRLPNEHRMN